MTDFSDSVRLAMQIRELSNEISRVTENSRCYSVVTEIIANTCDHLLLRARSIELSAKLEELEWVTPGP